MGCLWQAYKALSVLFFTLFLVLVLIGLFLLAGTGVVDVPVLSGLFDQDDVRPPSTTTSVVAESTPDQATGGADNEEGTPVTGATATPSGASAETDAIRRAEDAISQADEPGRFTIEVSDSDLTALLGELITSLDSPPVSNLVVTFVEDAFVADATITTPFRANVQATGHFVVAEDTLRIEFTEAKLGALTMPAALRDELTSRANEFLADEVGTEHGLRIDSVAISPGKIVVTGERLER